MLKGVPSGGTRVEELWQDKAIWTLKCKFVRLKCRWNCDRENVDRTAQKQQQTWESDNTIRHGSHWGESLQTGLRDEQTCGTTLASAYVLHCLSAMWLQLQMKGGKSEWK